MYFKKQYIFLNWPRISPYLNLFYKQNIYFSFKVYIRNYIRKISGRWPFLFWGFFVEISEKIKTKPVAKKVQKKFKRRKMPQLFFDKKKRTFKNQFKNRKKKQQIHTPVLHLVHFFFFGSFALNPTHFNTVQWLNSQ